MTVVGEGQPRFTLDEAQALAFERFGVRASASVLPSERDQNFLLEIFGGEFYVLKIANAAEREAVLDLQNQAMACIASQTISGFCPRVIPAKSGSTIERVGTREGVEHAIRLLTYMHGVPLARFRPHTPELLDRLGRFLGEIDSALEGYSHPAAKRALQWDISQATPVIERGLEQIENSEQRAILERFVERWVTEIEPRMQGLRMSVIQNDANDYNVIVRYGRPFEDPALGLVDFGDMLYTYTLSEVAIGAAYAILDKPDPLTAAVHVVRGYHGSYPLLEEEIDLLYAFMVMRLCISVAIAAQQKITEPTNTYLTISERPAWDALARLCGVSPDLATTMFREACGFSPSRRAQNVVRWLEAHANEAAPIVRADLKNDPLLVFDFGIGGLDLGTRDEVENPERLSAKLFGQMQAVGVQVGIGQHGEVRGMYMDDAFRVDGNQGPEWRTLHVGMDLFMRPGEPVTTPFRGVVHRLQDNHQQLDEGSPILLKHEMGGKGEFFFTLYKHLSPASLDGFEVGETLERGAQVGTIGEISDNGGQPPHVHFQILIDALEDVVRYPTVVRPEQKAVWLSICPDPNLILGIPEASFPPKTIPRTETLALRERHISRALSLAYRRPLKIVRGAGQFLFDENGRGYLDAVNNVAHVGHGHPRVVLAARDQMAVLNTNTRYLHDNLVRYAQRLSAKLPDPLRVCFFVNSGSEANDLALRLARTHTGREDILVVEAAYHGNLTSLIEISPYKFDGPGGGGALPYVHTVPMPDGFRGPYKSSDPEAGERYAGDLLDVLRNLRQEDRELCTFIVEPLMGVGGQVVPPAGYLAEAFRHVRAAGGVCIADEIQVGFGRVGTHFWGFETQGVVPDIVTLGKPIGNGHPLAAVVTTPEIAASFVTGMEYFNTFGGNPVSCAVGLAVLDVIEEQGLQGNALDVGTYLKKGLEALMERQLLIGDVRGSGLFLGVELVLDHQTLAAAPDHAAYVIERMKDHGVLLSIDGPLHNVIKIKPPMVFSMADADFLLDTLDDILGEDVLRID